MVKTSTVQKQLKIIKDKANVTENYFIGLLWNDPIAYYTDYESLLSPDDFITDVWKFYFEFGRQMYIDGIKKFDGITMQIKAKEYGLLDEFNEYGGVDTIEESISLVKFNSENIGHYYEQIKRNSIIVQLYRTFGDKVLVKSGKYDYTQMNKEQLVAYWQDVANQISLDVVQNYQAENLYIDVEEFITKIEQESEDMLPFYKSSMMNSITQGIAKGHVMMVGSFGNLGKSSFIVDKIVMSYIAHQEKAMIILNEESAQSFRQKVVLSILNHETDVKGFNRKSMVNGKLNESDKEQIRIAFKKMEEMIDGDDAQIKIIFMNQYIMSDLERIVKYYANRGYDNLLIDTHKVSDNSKQDQRWATFVEDMKTIYRLTRAEAGGCNLRTVVTFQLADSHIRDRFLTYDAMAEGKASKNEASVVMMFRPMFSDEFEGGKHALKCHKWVKKSEQEMRMNPKDTKEYKKEEFELNRDEGKIYYLLFTPKNRFGNNTDNGQEVLVIEPNFNFNSFREVGWTYVDKDFT